jgi:hypothetical protein
VRGPLVVHERVADQDVGPAEFGAGQFRGALPDFLVGHVARHRECGGAVGAQPGGDVVDLAGLVDQDQAGAFRGQPLGRGVSDAERGAGDQRGLAVEPPGTGEAGI